MSHKITNRLPHLCNGVHSWVFMSVIFMTVSKIECQNLEMIYNFLGEKHHNNYYKFGIKNTIHMKWASGWFRKTCPCHFVTGKLIKVRFYFLSDLKISRKSLFYDSHGIASLKIHWPSADILGLHLPENVWLWMGLRISRLTNIIITRFQIVYWYNSESWDR